MIFSRIIEHVRKQQWTGAVIELAIVILGVFIGLQVTNWNTARHDRALEEQYLQRLQQDIQLSIENAHRYIAFLENQYHNEGQMLGALSACQLDPAERGHFADGILIFGRFTPPPLVRGTIDELRSTGRLVLLRDVRLRQKLADTLELAEHDDGIQRMIYLRATREIAYIDQHTVLKPPKGGFSQKVENGKALPPPGSVDFDFKALCRDPRYAGAISSVQELTHFFILQNRTEQEDYKALLQIIDHDLRQGK